MLNVACLGMVQILSIYTPYIVYMSDALPITRLERVRIRFATKIG